VDNVNAANMTLSANLTDTLPTAPAAMVVAPTPNLTTTCPGGVGVVVAPAGSPTVRLNSGAVVPSGGCRVEVDVTAPTAGTYNNSLPVGALQSNFGSNEQPANASLKLSTLGYISGKVFRDRLAPLNGVFSPGTDTPIAGVEIQLRSGPSVDGTFLFTTNTDGSGNYLFSDLPAGTYSVWQAGQPIGTLNSVTRTGTIVGIGASTGTPGTASNPTPTSSQIVGIVLGNDGGDINRVSGSPNNDFSEVEPVSVSGTVFRDRNNDGLQQGADPALVGVEITLSGTDWQGNAVNRTTTTDASGNYSFTNLPPSNGTGYAVTEPTQPADTSNGITSAGPAVPSGTAGTATAVTTLPSRISGIVLPPGTNSTGNNFAEIASDRRVSGRVYRDFDDNGSFNGTDIGVSGQTIQLTGIDVNGNAVSLTTTTLADGTYTFNNVPESNGAGYTLTQPDQPEDSQSGFTTAGTTGGTATPKTTVPSRITGINLAGANTVSADNRFGEIDPRGPPPPGGWPTSVTAIPTLSEWSLLILSMVLAWVGMAQVRRRRAND
jgi:large repetitive protein